MARVATGRINDRLRLADANARRDACSAEPVGGADTQNPVATVVDSDDHIRRELTALLGTSTTPWPPSHEPARGPDRVATKALSYVDGRAPRAGSPATYRGRSAGVRRRVPGYRCGCAGGGTRTAGGRAGPSARCRWGWVDHLARAGVRYDGSDGG